MCTSVNNQPMSIIWNWASYGAFLFRHRHSQPFNGRLLGNSYLSVGPQFEFPTNPTNPFHTDPLQSGSAGSQLPESSLLYRESDKPVTVFRYWWSSHCLYLGGKGQRPRPDLPPSLRPSFLYRFAILTTVAPVQDSPMYGTFTGQLT